MYSKSDLPGVLLRKLSFRESVNRHRRRTRKRRTGGREATRRPLPPLSVSGNSECTLLGASMGLKSCGSASYY